MDRLGPVLGSIVFFVMAPVCVAGVVPWWLTGWRMEDGMVGWLGLPLILAGLAVLVDSVVRFALEGMGTPAPVYPTRYLVVTGLYRYMRNPMYLAVVSIVLGQALLFGSGVVLGYGLAIWTLFHGFVLAYEEPKLRKTYPGEYEHYCREVKRWLPASAGLHRGRS